jgi:hypothetical protein
MLKASFRLCLGACTDRMAKIQIICHIENTDIMAEKAEDIPVLP